MPRKVLGLAPVGQPHQVEVVTRALDQFLEPRPPRRLEGEEALARLRTLLRDDDVPPDPPEEALPHRILVMWRLARATSRLLGICAEDEALDAATEIQPSPWTEAAKPRLLPSQQAVLRRASAADIIALFGGGLPLLPPEEREIATRWCKAMAIMAADLGIERTEEGRDGLAGVLHPRTAAHSGVTETHVLAVEELLIDEAQKLIVECGERTAIDHFRNRYGFARKEAIGLIRLARADAMHVGGSSVEEDRALMIAQLKDLIARAKEEMNSDKELKALKQLAAIQGLTRTEPEDRAADFARVIEAIAIRQDRALEAPRTVTLKPAASVEDAAYTVLPTPEVDPATPYDEDDRNPANLQIPYDEDEEALAEYDKEN